MGHVVCGKSHECRVERLQVFLTVRALLGTVAGLSQDHVFQEGYGDPAARTAMGSAYTHLVEPLHDHVGQVLMQHGW